MKITELAQRMKAAAVRAKTATEEYASGHMSVSVCFAECEEFNRLTDGPDNIIALVEALEKAQQRIVELQQGCENDPRIHEIIDLKERIDNLESFRTAYMEWGEKTDWVQTDKRFDVLKPWGKHRADVLKEYIQHLEPRTVKLPKLKMLEDYLAEVAIEERKQILVGVKLEFHRACVAAGIKVEAE